MRRPILAILVVLALAAGLAGGLFFTWVVDPVEYYDSAPDTLYIQDKFVYLALIGDLYAYEGDLAEASARLSELGVTADGQVLVGLIEQYLDEGGQPEDVRNLARLTEDLGAHGGVLLVFEDVSTPTPVALAQPGARGTLPVTASTPEPEFRLVEQTSVCADPGQPGQIAVWVRDTTGDQMPGIEIVVSWPQGQDRFYTGLRPEKGAGYADFQMVPGTEYEVTLAGFRGDVAEEVAADLAPGLCPTGTMAVDWHLTFEEMP
jgi:hypothetical protein